MVGGLVRQTTLVGEISHLSMSRLLRRLVVVPKVLDGRLTVIGRVHEPDGPVALGKLRLPIVGLNLHPQPQ